MNNKKSYEKIIEINSHINKLRDEITILRPEAIKELYLMGYSMDRISVMLYVAKKDVLDFLHSNNIKIREKGRKK